MLTISTMQNQYIVLHDDVIVASARTRAEAQRKLAEYKDGL